MTLNNRTSQEFELKGKHVLLAFLAFFGVIITVNFTMATIASTSWTGLVVKNSYVASQQFNSKLASAAEQNARGWHSNMIYTEGVMVISLLDAVGEELFAEEVYLKIGRPAFEQEDQIFKLARQSDGKFYLEQTFGEGNWQINIHAVTAEGEYHRNARLHVRAGKKGSVR